MEFYIGQTFTGTYPPEEEWKNIPGFDDHYKISSFGRIISKYKGWKEKRPSLQKSGYLYVDLYINHEKRRSSIHRLVAEVFIPNLENKPQVNHKDGNKLNNSVSNLEWVTASENSLHATHITKTNTFPSGYKFSEEIRRKRREYYKTHPANCSKMVVCLETGEVFTSLRKAQEHFALNKRGLYLAIKENRKIKNLTFSIVE